MTIKDQIELVRLLHVYVNEHPDHLEATHLLEQFVFGREERETKGNQ